MEGATQTPSPAGPGRPSILELLRHAGGLPRLTRLASLVATRTGRDRETVIFGILDELQVHLDAAVPRGSPRELRELPDAVRGWFDAQIACEETIG